MNSFNISPVPVEQVFAGFEVQPRMDLVDSGLLVTQAKWEDRPADRISSCYPAAIINGAILVGALEPEVGHALHERLLSLPDNWIVTTHPDPNLNPIQGFRFCSTLQQAREWGADDVMYQAYATKGTPKAFGLKQLMHSHRERVLVDGKKVGASGLILGVLGQTVLVSGIKQHATTIVLCDGQILEIDPRNPHDPTLTTIDKLSDTWVRKTGPYTKRRILEAVINLWD